MSGGEQSTLVYDDPGILSVIRLSHIIRDRLDTPDLRGIRVRGEVTNFRLHTSGHMYFSLSDRQDDGVASIDCVIWRRAAEKISPLPQNGTDVIVTGYVDHYPPYGKTQFVADNLVYAGIGGKYLLLERWKQELAAEGCFNEANKQPIPAFPARVGVVTSKTGAVLHDIRNILSRRFPVDLILSPTQVQGEFAHTDIAAALGRIDGKVDVIIIARGGGSFDDLFSFNHPDVIRAIASCRTPVISAIGHEVDITLSDLAADVRAPTPSAAAELVVCDKTQLLREHAEMKSGMQKLLLDTIERFQSDLEEIQLRIVSRRIERRISDMRQTTAELLERLQRGIASRLTMEKKEISHIAAEIRSADIRAPLRRGYALLFKDTALIRSVEAIHAGDLVTIYLSDGDADAMIHEVRHDRDI